MAARSSVAVWEFVQLFNAWAVALFAFFAGLLLPQLKMPLHYSPRSILSWPRPDDIEDPYEEESGFSYFADLSAFTPLFDEMARGKHWTFTLNNYSDADEARLAALAETPQVSFLVYGREVGEENGTPHLQGFVSFAQRKRFEQVRPLIGGTAHIELARNVAAAIVYCRKDGDFVEFGEQTGGTGSRSDLDAFKTAVREGMLDLKDIREEHSEVYAKYTRFCLEYIQDHFPSKELEMHPLRPWQAELNARLNLAADERTIEFIVDPTGNKGKTWFAHYYEESHDDVQVLQPGPKKDMTYALDPTIRVLFIDAPRSKQGEFIQYDFLEDVKNGYVFSSKYESRVKKLQKVHVVCLMNEDPDMSKLSNDRYKITRL